MKIYAQLSTKRVEVLPESREQEHNFKTLNQELAGLGRVFNAATDWTYKTQNTKIRLESGDLVKVFKTVSDGDVCWSGSVKLDRSSYHHGFQEGLPEKEWSSMFYSHLPAKLERDGAVFYGSLEPYNETGTEGTIWALHEYGKSGYDGLMILEDGDHLTTYSAVYDGEVEWSGKMDFGPEEVSKIGSNQVIRQTNHMDTKKWLEMSWQHRPVIVTPR